MTYIELLKRVDSLAPLPKTILEIEEFKKTDSYETDELTKIIEQDPLMVSTILKTSNSAMFGFTSKVDTLSRAINLMGINFAISIAIGSGIKRALDSNLNAYNSTSDDFLRIANMQSNLVSLWIGRVDADFRNELVLPAFLQESGKFLINSALNDEGTLNECAQKISNNPNDLSLIEKEFVGMTTAEVTSAIFKHWNLTRNIISYIKFSDNPEKAMPIYKKHAQVLHIVKDLCNIINPLNDTAIQNAIKKAEEWDLNAKALKTAISKMEDRILDE